MLNPTFSINQVHNVDALTLLKGLPEESVHCIVTSPPYFGLRDYGVDGQIGLEETPEAYVAALVEVFRQARRVLRSDGTFWLNLGDSYAQDKKWGGTTGGKHAKGLHGETGIGRNRHKTGLPGKNLIGIPWRVAFALQADGWILRSEIIWSKPNAMPESVTDRPTKAHETIFLLTKCPDYYYDTDAVKEKALNTGGNRGTFRGGGSYTGGHAFNNGAGRKASTDSGKTHIPTLTRNKRSVWTISTKAFRGAHFATFPPKLIEPMILAGCPVGGTVLDPFFGAGTTGYVAQKLNRNWIGCEINAEYVALAQKRLAEPFTYSMFIDRP